MIFFPFCTYRFCKALSMTLLGNTLRYLSSQFGAFFGYVVFLACRAKYTLFQTFLSFITTPLFTWCFEISHVLSKCCYFSYENQCILRSLSTKESFIVVAEPLASGGKGNCDTVSDGNIIGDDGDGTEPICAICDEGGELLRYICAFLYLRDDIFLMPLTTLWVSICSISHLTSLQLF